MTPAERAVIDAARAWAAMVKRDQMFVGPLGASLVSAVAALAVRAPDEVNEAQP